MFNNLTATLARRAKLLLCLAAAALAGPFALFLLLDALFPFPAGRIADVMADTGPLLYAADGSLLDWRVDRDENWRLPVALSRVSPRLIAATVAVEDKRFFQHPGVDPVAAARAFGQLLIRRKAVSGASTLTMQTVKLLWPRPRRLSSKLVETFRAVQLERLVGKDGVLELYCNLAPYGGNMVGAEAAARRYFGKSAAGLTLGEAALLAGIPQSPARLDPRRHPEAALLRRRQVLERMVAEGLATPEEALAANRERLELEGVGRRLAAPHFAEWVRAARPGRKGGVVTTIDPDRQAKVERVAARLGPEWTRRGLAGPAVVVLSVRDSSVLCYLGNSNESDAPGRRVDAVRSRRQPGSLLKPFLFATLADAGAVAPSSRVYDLPAFWEGYAPRNIDRDWDGELSAGEALRRSRNVPAVQQLATIGPDAFAGTLAGLGLDPGRPDRQGLAMALGAGEQRLLELANAYAALARQGLWLPLRATRDDPPAEGARVWSERAAWLTLSALAPPSGTTAPARVWKTGTSWNQRDAWAVVATPEAVIGVWCGRQSGGGAAWAVGAEDALPTALDVADALGVGLGRGWSAPAGIEFREVCAASGEPPGWNCPERVASPFDQSKSSNRQCRRHADAAEPESVPASGATGKKTAPAGGLRIVSPAPGSRFVLGAGAAETLHFAAEAGSARGVLYWFVDGRLVASARPGETVAWRLTRGEHVVTVAGGDEGARTQFSVVAKE